MTSLFILRNEPSHCQSLVIHDNQSCIYSQLVSMTRSSSNVARKADNSDDDKKRSPERKVNKSSMKKSPSPVKTNGNETFISYPNRLFTDGSRDGLSLAWGKLPALEDKEPYLWPFFKTVADNVSYQETLCVDGIIPLRSKEQGKEDEPRSNGKQNESVNEHNPFQYYWYAMFYLHPDPVNNTVAWRKKWAANLVTMINYYTADRANRYKFPFVIKYIGDTAPALPMFRFCGDLLPTGEVLDIMEKSYEGTDMSDLVFDDEVLSIYFPQARLSKVRKFWKEHNPNYPGMENETVLDPEHPGQVGFEAELSTLPFL